MSFVLHKRYYISERILHHFGLCFTSKGFEIHKILTISGSVKMLKDYIFVSKKFKIRFETLNAYVHRNLVISFSFLVNCKFGV